MNELKIEYIPLEKLTPYEKNARLHTEVDLETIENSIQEFGMCDPIGIWSDKNIIIEGHGRLMALKALGHAEAPCIRLDHLTDEQRRAYALAHNKTAEMSKWDFAMVESELAELNLNMADFGFAELADLDVDNFFEDAEPKDEPEGEPDEEEVQCPHYGMFFKVN